MTRDRTRRVMSALADRYSVLEEIGSGGMATVYLAEDSKHRRKVAVKVLSPDLAEAVGPERFLREIQMSANLIHPHILPLFDSGEASGLLYYVMPFVGGESLQERLDREKQLPVGDAVRVTRQIAEALSFAHGKGVVHRDVKPGNILLEGGNAFLADFGIARALEDVGSHRLTATGVSLGTPAYMSPEQVSGEEAVDGRSDQYALGCVFFEMLAGHPPFSGGTAGSVMRQHLMADPVPVTQPRPSVPREVSEALRKALSKAPADRFNTTAEFGVALKGQDGLEPSAKMEDTANRHRQLAAVMFTDLVGYSSTVHQDEEAGRILRLMHRSAVESALALHDGTLLQYFGDGSLSIFPSAVEAVSAAQIIQLEFGSSGQGTLRIGIDLGDIAYDEQGAYGDAVNVASRLESLAEPGGVLISGKVRRELKNHPGFGVVPLGEVPLRNIEHPVPVFALQGEGIRTPEQLGGKGTVEVISPAAVSGPRAVRTVLDDLGDRNRASLTLHLSPIAEEDPTLGPIPLVGRELEISKLRALADSAEAGAGKSLFLTGDRGVGKSRVVAGLVEELVQGGWMVARGQAHSTEGGVPFAPFADAFSPLLSEIDPAELQLLAQGGARDLASLWPPLARRGGPELDAASGGGEARSRFFWTFSHFLATLTGSAPLILWLEDLEWADESSLDLLHFLVRQISDKRVFIVALYSEAETAPGTKLRQVSESLVGTRQASRIEISPLTRASTQELVTQLFKVPSPVVSGFADRLYDWTQGNSFFLEGALRGLVETGHLQKQNGRWVGWEVQELELPATVRAAILIRIGRLSSEARRIADLAAILGGQIPYGVLMATLAEPEEKLAPALQELVDRGILSEHEVGGRLMYGFSHPLISQTLEAQLSKGVARSFHARVARSLEAHYGPRVEEHVDELAYHFARAHWDTSPGKALQYLAAAGRKALKRNAHREAVRYLEAALARFREMGGDPPSGVDGRVLMESLARARASVGEQDGAIDLWQEALSIAEKEGDGRGVAALHRRLGRAHLSQGRLELALQAFGEGIDAARASGDQVAEARLRLVQGVSLQQVGRPAEAQEAVESALKIGTELGSREMVARLNRGLLLIHLWNGELELVREKGLEVRGMAGELGDPQLMFWAEWTLAAAAGLRGNTGELQLRIQELERLADRARSPGLRLWATELSLEWAYESGEWDVGLGIGEQAASLGRALNEKTILPRILVTLALIYRGRGETERARELVDEAWAISGADGVAAGVEFLNVHTVVPAHIGRAALLNSEGDWEGAIAVGEAGLELADRTGYVIWGIHRLLPVLTVAYLYSGRIQDAEDVGKRLREAGEELDHDLARAWASTAEAMVAWLKGDSETGARLLRQAGDLLEGIPVMFDAARVRRQLAGRLWEIGDRDGALEVLRWVYQLLEKLGARPELQKALVQFEEMGAEP